MTLRFPPTEQLRRNISVTPQLEATSVHCESSTGTIDWLHYIKYVHLCASVVTQKHWPAQKMSKREKKKNPCASHSLWSGVCAGTTPVTVIDFPAVWQTEISHEPEVSVQTGSHPELNWCTWFGQLWKIWVTSLAFLFIHQQFWSSVHSLANLSGAVINSFKQRYIFAFASVRLLYSCFSAPPPPPHHHPLSPTIRVHSHRTCSISCH